MKITSGPVYDTFRKGEVVSTIPRLLAEWNFNRFVGTTVTNIIDEEQFGYDPDMFPIDSIVRAVRPGKGIVKARIDEARAIESYQDRPNGSRYFLVDDRDKYKYWCSPTPSGTGAGAALSDARPQVIYDRTLPANRIVVGLETTTAAPDAWTVQVRNGTTWSTVATNPVLDSEGRVELWLTTTGWQATPGNSRLLSTATAQLDGVRIEVTSLDTPNKYLNVIELSLRHEKYLTTYLEHFDETFDMSDRDTVAPMGKASANVANITLFNDYVNDDDTKGFIFNNENADSPYFGMVDANVRFTLDYLVDATEFGGVDSEVVRSFTMWSDNWTGQRTSHVNVALRDSAKILQDVKPRPCLYNNLAVSEIVWRLCDSVGFDRYQITDRDDDKGTTVPHFWTDGQTTVWDIFSSLAESTQTAIFFDQNDVLQVWTRRQAFNESQPVRWMLRSEDAGDRLADITYDGDLTQGEEFEANKITVSYQVTEFSDFRHGYPLMETVWTPEDTLVLRASQLRRDINADNQDFVWLSPNDANIWPYEGIVNVEGELIRYNGKQFKYFDGGVRKFRIVNSAAERRKYNEKAPAAQRYKNGLTGGLSITKRGLWNSTKSAHNVEANGYSIRSIKNGVHAANASGFHFDKREGKVALHMQEKRKPGDYLLATRGQTTDSPWFYMGTSMRFPVGKYTMDAAGIVFNNSTNNEDGYYVEVRPTRFMDAKQRAKVQEISFYTRVGGVNHRLGGATVKVKDPSSNNNGKPKGNAASDKGGQTKTIHTGVAAGVYFNQWNELDIAYLPQNNNDHLISIWWNGQLAFNVTVEAGSGLKNAGNGKFGMFVRGYSKVEFDYLYAISHGGEDRPDNLSFFDRVRGGYYSNPIKEWVWRDRDHRHRGQKPHKPQQDRFNVALYDEFGPIVHEVREFDVKFDPKPVLHSRLILSNDYEAACPWYRPDSFGAEFVLANISRKNAVLQGADSTLTSDQEVNQQTVILGRALIQRDAKKIRVDNDAQILKRGVVELEFSSPWIQTKEDAQDLADWIDSHWGKVSDEVTVGVFGNPLFQIGDLVSINYPSRDFTPADYKYWVVGYNNNFDTGLTTTLTLRRCKLPTPDNGN